MKEMGFQYRIVVLVVVTLAVSVVVGAIGSSSVSDKDREECTEQLVGMATCLPYVGGDSKSPTPDCCNGLKQVLKNDKKCLCVIIVDRNDPQLGLNINVTLALNLPSVCHASANVSQCPELLHLAPNSTDAQVFYQFSKNTNQSTSTPAGSPTDEGKGSSASGSGSGESAQKISSNGCSTRGIKAWFGISMVVFLFFTHLSLD